MAQPSTVDAADTTADLRDADADLVVRLRGGDEAAFARLVEQWSPVMLHVARRYVSTRQAAEDVVQDTWLGVITGLPRFEGRSSLRSWTFSILLNQARTRSTRDARVVASAALTSVDHDAHTVDPARFQGADGAYPGHWTSTGAPRAWEAPEAGALTNEISELLVRALDALPERQRLIVQLRDIQGVSAVEACSAMSLSQQNQRVLLHRGRAALRAALEDYYRS
jgi:RNA polymerase sigma-70 factor (ECF subfamily)